MSNNMLQKKCPLLINKTIISETINPVMRTGNDYELKEVNEFGDCLREYCMAWNHTTSGCSVCVNLSIQRKC